jgi:hypothetical protein
MKRETIKSIILGLMGFIIVFLFMVLAFHIQVENNYKTKYYCDSRYGKDNWTFVDITGTPQAIRDYGRFYIGQVWECEPNVR